MKIDSKGNLILGTTVILILTLLLICIFVFTTINYIENQNIDAYENDNFKYIVDDYSNNIEILGRDSIDDACDKVFKTFKLFNSEDQIKKNLNKKLNEKNKEFEEKYDVKISSNVLSVEPTDSPWKVLFKVKLNINKNSNKYSKIIEKNVSIEGKGDAIPDTIRIEKDIEDKCTTYIFDSKYYTIDKTYPQKGKEEKKIVGFPSNSDIVKQVAYLKLIKSQYGEGDYFNSFLLPEYHERCSSDEKELLIVPESDWFRRIGYVLPGKFSLPISPKTKQDGEEEKVGLVFVDPDKLYDRYLKGYHASDEELKRTTAPMLL